MKAITNENDIKNIKLLYLAKYAPKSQKEKIANTVDTLSYAEYHHAIYRVLISVFPQLVSSTSPSILLKDTIEIDYIFSLYNRMDFKNSEIFISSFAEYKKLPYLGATPNIRALAEDKHLAKLLAHYLKIPTPEWRIYNVSSLIDEPEFNGPYFVKPRFGATSQFIEVESICDTWHEAKERILFLHTHMCDAILEKQINGVLHSAPVLANFQNPLFLPVVRQSSNHKGNIITYNQKRKIESGTQRSIIRDQNTLQNQIHYFSRLLFKQVQPLDYTRIDYIVDNESGIPYFLEFNVCCNLGEKSMIAQSAKQLGINYENLIINITYSSLFRQNIITSPFGYQF